VTASRAAGQPVADSPAHAEAPVGPDVARIADMVDALAEIGGEPGDGVTRLAYTPAERRAHEVVAGWLRDLGLEVRHDEVGNTIARREGSDPAAPAIAVGSHLDSVPHGGRFDGVAGVVGMIELVRLLTESGDRTVHPLLGVAFAAEEGARFGEPCIGSKLLAGALREPDLQRVRDADGTSLAAAMASVGLAPQRLDGVRWRPEDLALFLELHVEQGSVLETENRQIGLVDIVSGSTRLRLVLKGQANHSGATPMALRADALAGAADVVRTAEALATDPRHRGLRATVGRLEVWPNSTTTIPGRAMVTVDVRDTDGDRQRQAALELVERVRWTCERRGLRLEAEVVADTSPTVLTMWLRERIRQVCEELALSHRAMSSGASHDAQVVARLAPAAIVFVPSRGGLSHVPEEWTSATEIACGVEVLRQSVLRLDRFLATLRPGQPGKASTRGEAPEGGRSAWVG
jgi:allantoate deiminase